MGDVATNMALAGTEIENRLTALEAAGPGAPSVYQGPLRLESYGAPLDGSADGTPALDAAISDAQNGASRRIQWNGTLRLDSQPIPATGVHLEGDDIYGTELIKNFTGDGIIFDPAVPNYWGGGVHNMTVKNAAGVAGGTLFWGKDHSTNSHDQIQFEHLYLGGGDANNRPAYLIWVDGKSRNAGGAKGVRGMWMKDIIGFGTTGVSIYLGSVNILDASGVSLYPAPLALPANATLWVQGTATNKCEDINLTGLDIQGAMTLEHVDGFWGEGYVNQLTVQNTVSNGKFSTTRPIGSLSNLGSNFAIW